ncbi:MAG: Manganese transport system membrane protein MntB [Verrucomicrobia subdivision 3 bacterium]|nr:Manganese transport system membrane protein MntB [Limisphaerales bacterium]MCS1417026.1 Manganese transport system membrane protein MntB [Limisphaerales bacterium]
MIGACCWQRVVLCWCFTWGIAALGAPFHDHAVPESGNQSITDTRIEWPLKEDLWRVISLRDYNTRLVVVSTSLLGTACGLIGGFLLLRKRSLMGDTLSHATLPGICVAFMVMVALGNDGKALSGLLVGAATTGVVGFATVLVIRNVTRIKDDAAMGIVLSVFFGGGVALLGMIQKMPEGSAAGLESFIYGKAASMVFRDFIVVAGVTLTALIICIFLFKEFRMLCFDEGFAASQGWSVKTLDIAMLGLVTTVTVAGLQAVGLILVIAFLITPSAAARFWTHRLSTMLLVGAVIGGLSGWMGAAVSGLFPRLPAGAIVVLIAAGLFLFSMLFGSARGVLVRLVRQAELKRKIGRQHLLRAAYEWLEAQVANPYRDRVENRPILMNGLLASRSWSPGLLHWEIKSAYDDALIERFGAKDLLFTEAGFLEAAKVTRNHRLWELFLIENADIAPNHVDRDADAVEHVLGEDLVRELEELLPAYRDAKRGPMPGSPHPLPKGSA